MGIQEEPIRILQVLPALNFCGGIESYAMNYYRHIDKTKVQFDFVTHTNLECSYRQEILDMGGRVFELPVFRMRALPRILNMIDDLLASSRPQYKAIHCHMANAACFYFWKAKKYGICQLILHSHNSESADIWTHAIRNYPLLKLGVSMATERVACSQLAGEFLYGKKSFKEIHNAIDVGRFAFDVKKRAEFRKKLGWEFKIVIGHVGRMTPQKNQSYLLDIFFELQKKNPAYHLVMIGQGDDEKVIRQKIDELGLGEKVEIIPPVQNIEAYYCSFDGFVLPSLYEGLGLVLVEAQCSGLPTFASCDNIPVDVQMTDCFHFMSIKQPPIEWAKVIDKAIGVSRESKLADIRVAGYDIDCEAQKLENLYTRKEETVKCAPPPQIRKEILVRETGMAA